MKIALVHELLTMRGGAEKVLRILATMYPSAPIYTLLYDEEKLGDWFPRDRIRFSRLQKCASVSTNHHLYLPFFPRAVEAWDFSEFDLVISSSSAFVHGIITNGNPKHLCYVHSPARYLWDRTHEMLERASHGIVGPLRGTIMSSLFQRLRTWDSESADRPDMLLAPSLNVAHRIELYWRRPSSIVPPPIDNFWLTQRNSESNIVEPRKREYYLVASTLATYKKIDLAIEACNRRHFPLKIAGDGPDRKRLMSLAGPTVSFLGYQSEEALQNLYADAKAVIFPGDEDFGLVPLEAIACGTPVLALRKGGALETMIERQTAEFFDAPTPDAVIEAMERLERHAYSRSRLHEHATYFSSRSFEEAIRSSVANLMRNTH